ncbi:class II aldolase/adducin family protein [Bacteriovorax sp. Seq25_V]|uniref:class II aldolase/adducin family protein n=1 Tax=Bacteriovorax sp. Seq25_V TaxID=1201288 RepID=UPI00038A2725|nr:class II aldolase/adducin family protein [Bacteriovorax sp. Seq25_V]EQC47301.1 class II aldolase/adducin N-terminal domain protein [Bacteriovorax sp. Seq25_V]
MTLDEGVIKFDFSDYYKTESINNKFVTNIEKYRKMLFDLKLIGFYEMHQVGYGNISERFNLQEFRQTKKPQFVISGTQTGHLPDLDNTHYTLVLDYDLDRNKIASRGAILPSSESLTHAAIYEVDDNIGAVVHIHHEDLWKKMILANEPFTAKDVPYGTKQMANAVQELAKKYPGAGFAMAGHDDGIVTYGKDLNEAYNRCLTLYNKYITP